MKQRYVVRKGDGLEVEGDVTGVWRIDKRYGRYILSHVPTGYLVESARTKKFLTELISQPEMDVSAELSLAEVNGIVRAINRMRGARGWKA